MKAGWQVKPLGEVCGFENGDRGVNYPGRKAFVAEGVPFVNAGHLDKGRVDLSSMNFIPEQHFERLGSGKIRRGDLLFCLRGSLGKFALVDNLDSGAIASSLVIVRPESSLSARYLAYYFQSDYCADEILKYANGAAQPNLSAKSLASFLIPLPPLDEQKRIVAVLDEAFEGLDRARANAEANLADARELFLRELDNHFSELAQEVPVRVLGDVAEVKGGRRLPEGEELTSENTGFPYISVRDFGEDGTVNPRKLRYISEKAFQQISRYVIYSSDLYVSIAGTIGKTGIIPKCLDGANLTENAARLVLRGQVGNEYLYYFTRTSDFERQVGLNTRTAAQPKLALSRLATIRFPVPDISRQTETVEKFDALRQYCEEIETQCRAKIADLATLRQSLLQKAFSGELG